MQKAIQVCSLVKQMYPKPYLLFLHVINLVIKSTILFSASSSGTEFILAVCR